MGLDVYTKLILGVPVEELYASKEERVQKFDRYDKYGNIIENNPIVRTETYITTHFGKEILFEAVEDGEDDYEVYLDEERGWDDPICRWGLIMKDPDEERFFDYDSAIGFFAAYPDDGKMWFGTHLGDIRSLRAMEDHEAVDMEHMNIYSQELKTILEEQFGYTGDVYVKMLHYISY